MDLEDWRFVPTRGVLLTQHLGPVGWEMAGSPMPLQVALCMAGLPLAVKHLKQLIKHLGGKLPPGQPNRKKN